MNETTRAKLNSLRRPMLDLAIRQQGLGGRYKQIAFASGLGEAFVARRTDIAARRAANKIARASRKRNRG